MPGPGLRPPRVSDLMLIQRVRRRVTRELATHFIKRQSRIALQGRYVSICFDDFPASAASAGAEILQDTGARGTYYLSAGLSNSVSPVGRIADVAATLVLANSGHEIGCHTYGHKDCTQLSRSELTASLDANQRAVNFCKFNSFAYPFGYWDWDSKATVLKRFNTVRTGVPGLNQGQVDLAGLKSVPLYESLGVDGVDRWLGLLGQAQGWLIFYTHDVEASPSKFGCTPGLLAHCLKRAQQLGFEIETVGMVASRLD